MDDVVWQKFVESLRTDRGEELKRIISEKSVSTNKPTIERIVSQQDTTPASPTTARREAAALKQGCTVTQRLNEESLVNTIDCVLRRSASMTKPPRVQSKSSLNNDEDESNPDGPNISSNGHKSPHRRKSYCNGTTPPPGKPTLPSASLDPRVISEIQDLRDEVDQLKSDMAEMKSCLRLTFDMQIELQKSFRQEMATLEQMVSTQHSPLSSIAAPAPPQQLYSNTNNSSSSLMVKGSPIVYRRHNNNNSIQTQPSSPRTLLTTSGSMEQSQTLPRVITATRSNTQQSRPPSFPRPPTSIEASNPPQHHPQHRHSQPAYDVNVDNVVPRKPPVRCAVCLAADAESTVYSCGHHCVCRVCGDRLKRTPHARCPLCRRPVDDVLRTAAASSFRSQREQKEQPHGVVAGGNSLGQSVPPLMYGSVYYT